MDFLICYLHIKVTVISAFCDYFEPVDIACIFLLQNNRCITEVFNTDFCVVTAVEELDHQEVISLMNETVCVREPSLVNQRWKKENTFCFHF